MSGAAAVVVNRADENVPYAYVLDPVALPADSWRISYDAGAHGHVAGPLGQLVGRESSGTTVTAVPQPGYRFVKWSDGVTTSIRRDRGVAGGLFVSAMFLKQ
jgi:hypothetical protein